MVLVVILSGLLDRAVTGERFGRYEPRIARAPHRTDPWIGLLCVAVTALSTALALLWYFGLDHVGRRAAFLIAALLQPAACLALRAVVKQRARSR